MSLQVSLYTLQCLLDNCGVTDLVIDLVTQSASDELFTESIQLGIKLLDGGNRTVQVSAAVAGRPPGIATA